MRKVHTQLAPHYLIIIQVADCRCSSVCICEFSESKAFWLASVVVVDKSEVENLTHLTKYVVNNFFSQAWKVSILVLQSDFTAVQTIRDISYTKLS